MSQRESTAAVVCQIVMCVSGYCVVAFFGGASCVVACVVCVACIVHIGYFGEQCVPACGVVGGVLCILYIIYYVLCVTISVC